MPPSMRRQTKIAKRRLQRDSVRQNARKKALSLLTETSCSVPQITRETGVSKTKVYTMRKLLKEKKDEELSRILSPTDNRSGRPRVLSTEEEDMISQRLRHAARRGFPMDVDNLRYLMSRVVADGRKVPPGFPRLDAVRSFRARHRELTYRKTENKEAAKLRAESYEHVRTYVDVFRDVDRDFPGLLQDADRLWNMDETAVNIEFGERSKSFTSSSSHYGGFNAVPKGGNGKHVTAVVAASASGLVAPPFLIVAGKNVMSKWFAPLHKNGNELSGTYLYRYNDEKWFSGEGFVVCTENSSMEKEIMPLLVQHLNRFIRTVVPSAKDYVLCLDGYSSRKGVEWLYECLKHKCQAVQSPVNTTQVLQPCDQAINKTFNTTVRKVRDTLFSLHADEQRSVKVKLMSAIQAYESITIKNVHDDFKETGLWPMRFDFADCFLTASDARREHAEGIKMETELDNLPVRAAKRQDHASTAAEILEMMSRIIGPSRKLQAVHVVLKRNETVNDVLMSVGPGGSSRRSSVGGDRGNRNSCKKHEEGVDAGNGDECEKGKNAVLMAGTPALYLTHSKRLAEPEKKIKEAEKAQAEKIRFAAEKKKKPEREVAEKLVKRNECAKRKAERDKQKSVAAGGEWWKKGGRWKSKGDENKENCNARDVVRVSGGDPGTSCPLATLAHAPALERSVQGRNEAGSRE